MTSATTPQAYRSSQDNPIRNALESELWDDQIGTIFFSTSTPLLVPIRRSCRLLIIAQATLNAAGNLTISVDTVAATSVPVSTVAGPLTAMWVADVKPKAGGNSITISSTATLTNIVITVRRGTKPAGIGT